LLLRANSLCAEDYARFQRGNRFVMDNFLKIPTLLNAPKTPNFSYLSPVKYLKKV